MVYLTVAQVGQLSHLHQGTPWHDG